MSSRKPLTKNLADYDNTDSFGSRLRARRITPLLEMIRSVYRTRGSVRIVDIGGTERYWNILPQGFFEDHRLHITIVNLYKPSATSVEGRFTHVMADACALDTFADRAFDIAHSNSVVEHVGDWKRMLSFATEVSRVADRYFVQTPNYWFPVEPHCMTPFFHWLPRPSRVWLVLHFSLGHWKKASTTTEAMQTVEGARLLNRRMFQELFKDARILTERYFLLPKSFIALRD